MTSSRILFRDLAAVFALVLGAGCGSIDQAPDAPPAAPPLPPAALVSAGGALTSSTYTLDVQIGDGLVPQRLTAGAVTLTPSTPLEP